MVLFPGEASPTGERGAYTSCMDAEAGGPPLQDRGE